MTKHFAVSWVILGTGRGDESNMVIRVFEQNDIDDCVIDFIQSFNSPPWNEGWSKKRANDFINDIFSTPKFIGFILSDGDKNISYALCFTEYWWNKDDRCNLYVELFFTNSNYQQKGYGTMLLEHIEKYAQDNGLRGIMLFTKKDKPAYSFYAKSGFVELNNLPNIYKPID